MIVDLSESHSYHMCRLDRLRKEDELKGRQTKKASDAEQTLLSKVCCKLYSDVDTYLLDFWSSLPCQQMILLASVMLSP